MKYFEEKKSEVACEEAGERCKRASSINSTYLTHPTMRKIQKLIL